MKKLMAILTAASMCMLSACGASNSDKTSKSGEDSSVLVAYFSAQGHTRSLAEKVAKATNGDLFEIEPEQPYTEADLDGWNDSARGTRESKDRTTRPGVKSHVENFEKYDTIYL